MEENLVKADSSNLLATDAIMFANFFAANEGICSAEYRNIKTSVFTKAHREQEKGSFPILIKDMAEQYCESVLMLENYGQITQQLAIKVLLQFDKCINNALATRVKSRLTFKAGKLNTYRFCDNVWTFMLNDVEFREVQEVAKVDKVKIVACDGKSMLT